MKKNQQTFKAPCVDGKSRQKTYAVRAANSDEAAKKMLEQGYCPMAIPQVIGKPRPISPAEAKELQLFARPVGNATAYKQMHASSSITQPMAAAGPDKGMHHFAALSMNPKGKEGLALVDAPNPNAAKAKLESIGVTPYHTPVMQPLKFDHGNAITKVHDDGDLSATVSGKPVVITTDGQVYGTMGSGQKAFVKQSLGNSVNALKASLIKKFERGKLPGAPLVNGVPKPPRRVHIHLARSGSGLTRRSDR